MRESSTYIYRIGGPIIHTAASGSIAVGILSAVGAKYIFRHPQNADTLLLIAIGMACIPLCIELIRGILTWNLRIDILAGLAVLTAMSTHQFWVAAIVILVASGSTAFEEYAARRTFSVLNVLDARMPQIAHCVHADGSICDVKANSVTTGNRLLLYPHELCPVDGVVLDGFGSMDEAYLAGEPLLVAKAPCALVFSGTVNGNAALTIEATRQADDSRYEIVVEILRKFAAKASATSSAWSPNGQLVSGILRCESAGKLTLQQASQAFFRCVDYLHVMHAAHG